MNYLVALALGAILLFATDGSARAESAGRPPAVADEATVPVLSESDTLKLRLLVTERELLRQAQRADRAERELGVQAANGAIDRFVRELAAREGFDLEEYQPNPMTGRWEQKQNAPERAPGGILGE